MDGAGLGKKGKRIEPLGMEGPSLLSNREQRWLKDREAMSCHSHGKGQAAGDRWSRSCAWGSGELMGRNLGEPLFQSEGCKESMRHLKPRQ